jgi:hypothetical protein
LGGAYAKQGGKAEIGEALAEAAKGLLEAV